MMFEYTCKFIGNIGLLVILEAFNNLGKDGWELVTIYESKAYFKRLKE